MTAVHAISILIIGFCLDFIGGLLKILHTASADTVLLLAAALKVAGALLFLYKLTTYPKFKDFFDR
jgi:hypothetical protein